MKAKYPVEPFAVAFIMFTASMQQAVIVGIMLLAASCVGCVLRSVPVSGGQWTNSILSGFLTAAAIVGSFLYVGVQLDTMTIIGIAFLALFVVRYVFLMGGNESVNNLVLQGAVAYRMLMLAAYFRELLGSGTLFGSLITDGAAVSGAYLKPAFGFILAGLGLGLTNRILKCSDSDESLWTLVPMTVLYSPFVLGGVPEIIGGLAGTVLALVAFMAVRQRLLYSSPLPYMKRLPVHFLTMGIIYMVMTVL